MRKFALAAAISLIAGTAIAAPVNWIASGWINGGYGSYADLPLSPQVGDAFSYSIVFDDATADTFASPYSGNFPGAIQSATFSIGDQSFDLPIGAESLAYTYNDFGADYYQLSFQVQSAPWDTVPFVFSHFSIWSTSPLALDTDGLPAVPPSDLSLYWISFEFWERTTLEHVSGAVPTPAITGNVSSIVQRPMSVPEPTAAILLAMGLFGAGLARRRRA